jgi:hypothetical protein
MIDIVSLEESGTAGQEDHLPKIHENLNVREIVKI